MMLSAGAFGCYNCSEKKKKKKRKELLKSCTKTNKRKTVNLSERTSTAKVGHYWSECDHQPLNELRSHTDDRERQFYRYNRVSAYMRYIIY